MAKVQSLSKPFQIALKDLFTWFHSSKVRGLVIGGVALAFLGRPRLTKDIDALVMVNLDDVESFLKSGRHYSFVPRISDPIAFAKKNRVLLLKHTRTKLPIDISLGALSFEEESFQRSKKFYEGNLSIRFPTTEDLVIMKAVAHRPQDLADVETLLLVNPRVDLRRIRKWVKEFAKVLEMPELLQDLERLLKETKK